MLNCQNTVRPETRRRNRVSNKIITVTQPIEYMPRDRRSMPVFEAYDENELPEQFDDNQEVPFNS